MISLIASLVDNSTALAILRENLKEDEYGYLMIPDNESYLSLLETTLFSRDDDPFALEVIQRKGYRIFRIEKPDIDSCMFT